jgi:GxxExxY protein
MIENMDNYNNKEDILFQEESYRINSCIFEVNKKLGSGFLEAVYQEALEIELTKAGIPFERKKQIKILYDGKPLKHEYEADLVCYGKIIVELKAVNKLAGEHKAQVINYLAATGLKLGILVNFNACPKAEIIRLIRSRGS